jgi:hypothetical protein
LAGGEISLRGRIKDEAAVDMADHNGHGNQHHNGGHSAEDTADKTQARAIRHDVPSSRDKTREQGKRFKGAADVFWLRAATNAVPPSAPVCKNLQKKSAAPKPRRFVVIFLPVAKAIRVRHTNRLAPLRYSIA